MRNANLGAGQATICSGKMVAPYPAQQSMTRSSRNSRTQERENCKNDTSSSRDQLEASAASVASAVVDHAGTYYNRRTCLLVSVEWRGKRREITREITREKQRRRHASDSNALVCGWMDGLLNTEQRVTVQLSSFASAEGGSTEDVCEQRRPTLPLTFTACIVALQSANTGNRGGIPLFCLQPTITRHRLER